MESGDPAVQAEIEDWCRAAQVRRRFRNTNLAQIGRPYPGMMYLYIDETNLYHRMFLYTKQFDWEKMWAIADDITDEDVIRAKAQDILDTFDIEDGGMIEKVWEMAKYVVAFEQWVKEEQIAFIASHYDGFAQGKAGISRKDRRRLSDSVLSASWPVTYLGITQDRDGNFKFIVAESVNEPGPIFNFGDTNMRTRFTCGAREFCNKWSEAGPTHHMAAAAGKHIDTILKVAKIFNVPLDIITR